MNYFYIIGNGFIADKHYEAITNNNGTIKAVLDPFPKGNIDAYNIDAKYFNKEREFFKYLKNNIALHNENIMKDKHYVVILTPNYLHYKYIMKSINYCDVICEKPLVTNYKHYDKLYNYVNKNSKKKNIYQISQLRLINTDKIKRFVYDSDVNYIEVYYFVSRGEWYDKSWKSNPKKSGGLLYNIAIHPIDLIVFTFGKPDHIETLYSQNKDLIFVFNYAPTLYRPYFSKNLIIKFYVSVNRKLTDRRIKFYSKEKKIEEIDLWDLSSGLAVRYDEIYEDILSEGEKSKFNIKYFYELYKTLNKIKRR